MRFPTILVSLVCATMTLAYSHGEIPGHYAIRAENGVIDFFHESDKRSFEASKLVERVVDPHTDTYPVTNDETGIKAFNAADAEVSPIPAGGATSVAAEAASATPTSDRRFRFAFKEKRQTGESQEGEEEEVIEVDNDEPAEGVNRVISDGFDDRW